MVEDIYATGYFRQGDRANIKLPFKWMAIESLNDAIFTEKTDVVRKNIVHVCCYSNLNYIFAVVVWCHNVGGV